MKLMGGLVCSLILLSLLFGFVSFSSTAKADMPIQDVSLSFNSISDLNRFFSENKFVTMHYDNGAWKVDVVLDKSKMYYPDNFYIIAPYQYMDKNGYPHTISESGCYISISNIGENVTVVITGFERSTIMVNNFEGHLIFGKAVYLTKKIESNQYSMDWGALIPLYNLYEAAKNIQVAIQAVGEASSPAFYKGISNTAISVINGNTVDILNMYVDTAIQTPVFIENAERVTFENDYISPSVHTKAPGGGVLIKKVNTVVFGGLNNFARYEYNMDFEDVKNIVFNGTVTMDGTYIDPKTNVQGKYGMGIFGNNIGNVTTKKADVNVIVDNEIFRGFVMARAVGNYNETNQTFWGKITGFGVSIYSSDVNGKFYSAIVKDNITISQRINLSRENQTINYTETKDYKLFNNLLKLHAVFSNFTVKSNTTGDINVIQGNNITYVEHQGMILYLQGYLGTGSSLTGQIPSGIMMRNLTAGLGVPDEGQNEKELIEYINATPMVNVDKPVEYNARYLGEETTMNVPLIFGGFSAIIGVFVAIGWMRIGIMMHSVNQQNREKAKDMIFKASIGTIISAMVIFGWANLVGLMNWVFGG